MTCPWCGAFERHRALCLYLRERTDLFSSARSVLHFAPEWSVERTLRALPHVEYLSADLESPTAMEHVDITALPYADGSFDSILCSHVLEHVPDDLAAMRELRRVLRPGGSAIVLVPLDQRLQHTLEDPGIDDPAERERVFWDPHHVRLYGRDFVARLERAGFEVTVDPWVRSLDPGLIERYGLLPEDDIYVCTRPG